MPRRKYEFGLLVLLSLTNGVVALERLSASFLSPYLVADLKLSNAQLGLLAGALSIAVGLSAFVFGQIADATGRHKTILLIATLAFSLIAGLPAFVIGFGGLFLCRFLLGFAEGPVVPLTQSMMAEVSDPRRRGLNIGILQMGGAFLIGGTIGPVIATMIADAYGWRVAFSASAIPGLLMALLLAWFVRPRGAVERAPAAARVPARQSIAALWRIRNIRTTVLISGLFAAWYTIQSVFLPIYLTSVKGLAPTTMGWIIGAGGMAALIGGIAVPALSDIVGRRPMMIACSFLAMAAPIAILMLPNDPLMLAGAVLIGWMVVGISPLYIGIVPSESAPLGLVTTAIGLTTAAGELVGGVIAPAAAGQLADLFGLAVPLYLCIGLAFACGVTCLCLTETNRSRSAVPQRFPAVPLQG